MSLTDSAEAPSTRKGGRGRGRFPRLAPIVARVARVGISVVSYPHVAQWFHQRDQSRIVGDSMIAKDHQQAAENAKQIALARKYNAALSAGAVLEKDHRLPTGSGQATSATAGLPDYDDILNDGSTDSVMARLQIRGIKLDLPVYHGTSDETLLKGVGHLEGTSLPVGGQGTHSVLTGHRGLADSEMFTRLNEVTTGDTFTVSTFGEVLTYRVVSTKVVDPSDTAALKAEAGKDLMTLVTCTPLGINSQRILVTGERVHPTPQKDIESAAKAPDIPGFPWWSLWLSGALVAAIVYVWRSGFPATPRGKRKRQG
ncbi:MAG: class C sortase [Galactobacter sp.]